jgi:hypothetical protein
MSLTSYQTIVILLPQTDRPALVSKGQFGWLKPFRFVVESVGAVSSFKQQNFKTTPELP